jgi:hypothetical protein
MDGDDLVTRREYITTWMRQQGITAPARKYIVLRNWCEIVDLDCTNQVIPPPLPPDGMVGRQVYVMAKANQPDLTRAIVLEDRGDNGLYVRPCDGVPVEFLVTRDETKLLPIPLRPHAIRRADLRLYIGDEAAAAYHGRRRARQRQGASE